MDLRYGFRLVRRNPGFAAPAVFCLALGIGVNATVFSFLDGLYFRMLPVPGADRVVSIQRVVWRDYLSFRSELHAFSGLAATRLQGTFLDAREANSRVAVEVVSANYGAVLRLRPVLGRWLIPADELPGAEPAAVIADHIWDRYFHRDPHVLGAHVKIEKQTYRIVGVAPASFRGTAPPVRVDAWAPIQSFPTLRAPFATPQGPGVSLVGRLAPGATAERASAEMAVANARRQVRPETRNAPALKAVVFRGIPSADSRNNMRSIAVLLLAVVAVVLLIACVNVANLLLARAAVRQREMALRRSLGASRGRLVRQGLAESAILAAGGAAVGILFGYWTDAALSKWAPASVPESVLRGISLDMNWQVAAFTAAVALGCAVLFGLAPALEGSSVDLVSALRADAGSGRRGRLHQRDVYVVAQVALSLVLLIGAGLLLRALDRTSHIDPGFATDHRLYMRLFASEPDVTPEEATALFTRLLQQARAMPGVSDATLSFGLLGFSDGECVSADLAGPERHASINVVDPSYFESMQVPLLRGRNFAASDVPKARRAIIVNETMAEQWWPGQDPVGQLVWEGCRGRDPKVLAQVIGVAKDIKYGELDESPIPFFYISRLQVWWNGYFALILHTGGDPHAYLAPLVRLARTGGPALRMYEAQTFDELLDLSLWRVRWQAGLFGTFGLLAIALSVIGLYGVVAWSVAQRTREIGVRMALGAQKLDVQWMVLTRGLRLTAAGIVLGLLLSAVATRFLRGFLYGVSPFDPLAFAGAALAWLLIAMLAGYLPARRAARVDPAISLRYE